MRVIPLKLGGHWGIKAWRDQLPMYNQVDGDVKDRELGFGRVVVDDVVYAEKPDALFW